MPVTLKIGSSVGSKQPLLSSGDKIRKTQRDELDNLILRAKSGDPKGLLRGINGGQFDALGKDEVQFKLTQELDKAPNDSIKGIFNQALEWVKGNLTDPWWIKNQ
jgi:hypothetical protein